MGQVTKISRNNTKVQEGIGKRTVKLYHTEIVQVDEANGTVTLDSGGWRTSTTKTRMNQTSNQWGLGFGVSQKAGEWFVTTPFNGTQNFQDGMTFAVRW